MHVAPQHHVCEFWRLGNEAVSSFHFMILLCLAVNRQSSMACLVHFLYYIDIILDVGHQLDTIFDSCMTFTAPLPRPLPPLSRLSLAHTYTHTHTSWAALVTVASRCADILTWAET